MGLKIILKELLRIKKMKINELGTLTQIPVNTLYGIMRTDSQTSEYNLKIISEKLKVPVIYLKNYTDNPESTETLRIGERIHEQMKKENISPMELSNMLRYYDDVRFVQLDNKNWFPDSYEIGRIAYHLKVDFNYLFLNNQKINPKYQNDYEKFCEDAQKGFKYEKNLDTSGIEIKDGSLLIDISNLTDADLTNIYTYTEFLKFKNKKDKKNITR